MIILKDYGDTTFITGMRAYAALAVVLTHAGGSGFRLGQSGVAVFFVISGFSVAASYARTSDFFSYVAKRLARIAPLYYLWMAVAIATGTTAVEWQRRFDTSVDGYNVLMHLAFLSCWDFRIATTIIGVEWTLPIEVTWYLVLPFLFNHLKSAVALAGAALAAVGTLVLIPFIRAALPLPSEEALLAIHWSPLPYALSFVAGIAAYRFREWGPPSRLAAGAAAVAAPVSIAIWGASHGSESATANYLFFTLLAFALVRWGSGGSRVCAMIFCNPAVLLAGTLSYGLYLSHMPVLKAIQACGFDTQRPSAEMFVAVVAISLGVSWLLYVFFEVPMSHLAARLTNNLRTVSTSFAATKEDSSR